MKLIFVSSNTFQQALLCLILPPHTPALDPRPMSEIVCKRKLPHIWAQAFHPGEVTL